MRAGHTPPVQEIGEPFAVRTYAPRWLAAQRHRLAPRTLELYAEIVRVHLLPALGDRPLQWLRRQDIRAFLEGLLATHQPRTVQTVAGCLSSLLASAVDDGLLLHNPARGATHHLWPPRDPLPKALLPEELARLLAAADGGTKHHDAFLVLARTGLRLGELLALRAGAIDRAARTLAVTATWHTRHHCEGPPKGGQGRVVDVSQQALGVLDQRCAAARPYLFAAKPGVPYSKDALEKAFRRAAGLAGLPAHLTPHCLRHTFASTLLTAGAPVQYVQQQLGHASIEITVSLYGSWLRASRHDLVDLLDQPAHLPPARVDLGAGRLGALKRRGDLSRT